MDESVRRQIEEIMERMECPKGFTCVSNELEGLCKAKDFGLNDFVYCLENPSVFCKFSLPFSYAYLCHCPLRVFIAKELGK